MKTEILKEIAEYTKGANIVVVEAAHIYTDQNPSEEQSGGAIVARALLEAISSPTQRMLFIDDFHPTEPTLDISAYQGWLANLGYPVDQTLFESALVPDAHLLLAKIKEIVPKKKLSYPKNDGWQSSPAIGLWTPRGKVSLITHQGDPSCSLLDASLYLKKAEMGEVALTVLPQCYLPQQLDTLALLAKVGHASPIINVFFDPINPLESASVMFSKGAIL